jgi:hypothetical protein
LRTLHVGKIQREGKNRKPKRHSEESVC